LSGSGQLRKSNRLERMSGLPLRADGLTTIVHFRAGQ
jgi:hypothetical protein